jgi:hypothetical protein
MICSEIYKIHQFFCANHYTNICILNSSHIPEVTGDSFEVGWQAIDMANKKHE